MQIIEHFIQGKVNLEQCEDVLVQSPHFLAVVDGVTSKSSYRMHGKTTGRLVAELVGQCIEQLPFDSNYHLFLKSVNTCFHAYYQQNPMPEDAQQHGLQAAAVVYSRERRELWFIGDCQALVDGLYYSTPKHSDTILAEMRSLVLHLRDYGQNSLPADDGSVDEDPGRTVILPWILQSTTFANREAGNFGYAVLNGQPIPDSLVQIVSLDEDAHEVVLASDGYPKLFSTLEKSEAYLQHVLQHDPHCYREYLSTKGTQKTAVSFDDRSYIRFKVPKL